MTDYSDIVSSVKKSAAKRIIYLPHAVRQMSRPDRIILVAEVRNVVERGELVEDYPEDVRGHSCLLLGYKLDDTPIHVVCSPKGDYLAIITAYIPNPEEWECDYKRRRRR
ncbi:DUF4258 domain-containing protein [Chlorobium phaeobacteroides]|jgi:hypothetical protein|uniref:DUF4258 domain-containing protein n=1 Tax=Chlorobium phaeobacteroides (strain DSM 266 / SMG 266 / 2430) TaxID=290317 RepID=A1BGC7_CHLPD|nr:DUF4258 domain-containing protein [Chlorobium phaeobacteroides]ABL65454.1 conserved hypothetical protein [Chlorobium phaeobacteroides DSM 266]